MGLPRAVGSHHTVWIDAPGLREPVPVRYASDDDTIYCFGDNGLENVPNGERVSATVHEITGKGGHRLAQVSGTLREIDGDDITDDALLELLAHVSLGRDLDEVRRNLDHHRARRRILAIGP
ncbi:MAG: hypothetical protein R3A49_00890 [Acidimicrobiia bacterium]